MGAFSVSFSENNYLNYLCNKDLQDSEDQPRAFTGGTDFILFIGGCDHLRTGPLDEGEGSGACDAGEENACSIQTWTLNLSRDS